MLSITLEVITLRYGLLAYSGLKAAKEFSLILSLPKDGGQAGVNHALSLPKRH